MPAEAPAWGIAENLVGAMAHLTVPQAGAWCAKVDKGRYHCGHLPSLCDSPE